MQNFKNIEKLTDEARKNFLPYAKEMLNIHKDNILSIFIYGSSASGDPMPGTSGINSTIVFKALGFLQLKDSLRVVDKGIRKRIAAPLFFTPEYINSSLDTFPLEFLEMKENNTVIFGEDLLADIEINASHIRFICEEQLKGKLIRIRQAYLEIGLRSKGIEVLIKESLGSLFPVFRGLLRLKGIKPPVKKEEAIGLLGETFGIDSNVFMAILKDKENDEKIGGLKTEAFLSKYIKQIERLAEISDSEV
ncbi:MAG: hypothetical protein ABH843_03845 [Candidatus Omnitrophota bacterium]